MSAKKEEIKTLKEFVEVMNDSKPFKPSPNVFQKQLYRKEGPISLDIFKGYIDLCKNIEGISRVSIGYKLEEHKNAVKYRLRVSYAFDINADYSTSQINEIPYKEITQSMYEDTITSKRKYNIKENKEEKPETKQFDLSVHVDDEPKVEVLEKEEETNSNMVLIHEKKTTTIQEERKVMIVNKAPDRVIKMVEENFFEFDKTTADILKISENANNIIKSIDSIYKNGLVEKINVKLDQLFYYKDVIDITKYLLNRGARYVIVNELKPANTKYPLPSVGFTVFKKSYKKTRSNIFGFALDQEKDIKDYFEDMFKEYRSTLKTVSYIVYDYLKKGYYVFKNKTVKLKDIYDIARINNEYGDDDEHKTIPEMGYITFKACVRKAVNPDRLINVNDSDISYIYNYQTFKQLNEDCYFNFNKKPIVTTHY